jgi:hypothetical protein
MWNNELTLIGEGTIEYDDIGNPIPGPPIETTVFCEVNSISRGEFYSASMAGLKPSIIFTIHPYEYSKETYIEFSEDDTPKEKYRVIKTYKKNSEELELTCEKVAGNV